MQQTRPEAEKCEHVEWSLVLEQQLVTVMRAIETAALRAEGRGGPTEQESTIMKEGEIRLSELLTILKKNSGNPQQIVYQCAIMAIRVQSKEHPLVVKCLRIMGIYPSKNKVKNATSEIRGSAMQALNRKKVKNK